MQRTGGTDGGSGDGRNLAVAAVALILLSAGCTQTTASGISVTLIQSEAGVQIVDASPDVDWSAQNARCCVLATDAGFNPSDECALAAHGSGPVDAAAAGLSEPCLEGNTSGSYGLWSCGADASQMQCGDNGLSCAVGDPCMLADIRCPGVVQACAFSQYTPPPG